MTGATRGLAGATGGPTGATGGLTDIENLSVINENAYQNSRSQVFIQENVSQLDRSGLTLIV